MLVKTIEACSDSISYPESSGFLVSGATPGRLWGHQKNSIFLIGCSVTVSIVSPQKSCGNKIRCPQNLPGIAPLTKKPEDSGYEIGSDCTNKLNFMTIYPHLLITHRNQHCAPLKSVVQGLMEPIAK